MELRPSNIEGNLFEANNNYQKNNDVNCRRKPKQIFQPFHNTSFSGLTKNWVSVTFYRWLKSSTKCNWQSFGKTKNPCEKSGEKEEAPDNDSAKFPLHRNFLSLKQMARVLQ